MPRRIVFNSQIIGPWVCSRTGGCYEEVNSSAIGLEQNGRLIAGVLYDQFNGRSICMHVAAEPGARWMTREYLRVCFDYPFNQAKVQKILGLVDSTNLSARRFDEHLGFVLESTIKDAGSNGDLLIYTMTRQQCRHLKETHDGRQIFSSPSSRLRSGGESHC